MIKTTIYTICYIDQDNDKRIRTQMKTVTDIRNKNAKNTWKIVLWIIVKLTSNRPTK